MTRFFQSNKFLAFFPLFLFLINLLGKGLFLTAQEVSHDEPFSIYHAQFDLSVLIDQLKGYNNPPLYEILLHVWIKMFGISAASVRMLPLLFASLSAVTLYYFGKKFFSVSVAVGSSVLLSFSNLITYHAHDCRVYTLFMLLSILSMYYFLSLLNDQLPKLHTKFLFVLVTVLLIYAHYFGFFVVFLQGVHLLIFYRRSILKFFAYYVMICLLYLPHIITLFKRFGHSVKGTWLAPPSGIESLYNMLWSFSNEPVITVACIAILVIGLAFVVKTREAPGKNSFLGAMWFLFPFTGMFFISYSIPMYISRYLIYAVPAYYVLLFLAIERIGKNKIIHNLLFALVIIGFAITVDLNPRKNTSVTNVVKTIKEMKKKNTALIIWPFDLIDSFTYNYNINYFSAVGDQKEYHLTDSLLRSENIYFVYNADGIPKDISRSETLLFLQSGDKESAAASGIPQFFNANYQLVGTREISERDIIYLYKKK